MKIFILLILIPVFGISQTGTVNYKNEWVCVLSQHYLRSWAQVSPPCMHCQCGKHWRYSMLINMAVIKTYGEKSDSVWAAYLWSGMAAKNIPIMTDEKAEKIVGEEYAKLQQYLRESNIKQKIQ